MPSGKCTSECQTLRNLPTNMKKRIRSPKSPSKNLELWCSFFESIPSHFNNCQKKHLKFNSKSSEKLPGPKRRSILPSIIFQVKTLVCAPGLASTNLQVERVQGTWLLRVFLGDEILPSYVRNISFTIVKLTLKKAKTRNKIHGLWKGLTSF